MVSRAAFVPVCMYVCVRARTRVRALQIHPNTQEIIMFGVHRLWPCLASPESPSLPPPLICATDSRGGVRGRFV